MEFYQENSHYLRKTPLIFSLSQARTAGLNLYPYAGFKELSDGIARLIV
jgi:hypothetical protein